MLKFSVTNSLPLLFYSIPSSYILTKNFKVSGERQHCYSFSILTSFTITLPKIASTFSKVINYCSNVGMTVHSTKKKNKKNSEAFVLLISNFSWTVTKKPKQWLFFLQFQKNPEWEEPKWNLSGKLLVGWVSLGIALDLGLARNTRLLNGQLKRLLISAQCPKAFPALCCYYSRILY